MRQSSWHKSENLLECDSVQSYKSTFRKNVAPQFTVKKSDCILRVMDFSAVDRYRRSEGPVSFRFRVTKLLLSECDTV
jgi:hypothetical protein